MNAATAMSASIASAAVARPRPGLLSIPGEPHWYAVHIHANREKLVAGQLALRSVEHFLPLYAAVRHWKDRDVRLEVPLFPGYVFVRLALGERLRVLQISGVARLVGFGGIPAALPGEEIAALQTALGSGARARPHPYLAVGRKVLVKTGPLAGMEGILVKKNKRNRFVISINLIHRSVAVEVDGLGLQSTD